MREILFRGKPKQDDYLFTQIWEDNCKDGFVYGSLIVDIDKYYICVGALCNRNSNINNGIVSMIEVIPETVGQYTGLKDKNGTKIFEGDIVKGTFLGFPVSFYDYTFSISWQKDVAGYKANSFKDVEVVGNIYDNPSY